MSIGAKIRQVRHLKGVKQEELATCLNISQGTLSKIENDSLPISAINLIKVAEFMKTPLNEFLPEGVFHMMQIRDENEVNQANDKIFSLETRIKDFEEWIKDLKSFNLELKEKIINQNIIINDYKREFKIFSDHLQHTVH